MALRRNQIVRIEFSDHVENGTQPIRCVAYGRIAGLSKTAITIECWGYADRSKRSDDNCTRYTIVRAAIHSICQLHSCQEG